ncbi:hypothetical protein ACU4GD_14370 [Cupriavidus basilensis]
MTLEISRATKGLTQPDTPGRAADHFGAPAFLAGDTRPRGVPAESDKEHEPLEAVLEEAAGGDGPARSLRLHRRPDGSCA